MMSFFKCCRSQESDRKLIHKVVISVTDYEAGQAKPTKYYGTFFYDNGDRENREVSEFDSNLFAAEKSLQETQESIQQSLDDLKTSVEKSLEEHQKEVRKAYSSGSFTPYIGFRPFSP